MKIAIFWFRRDLRLIDNKGLYFALRQELPILPLFIFDDHIVGSLPANDHRISYIHHALIGLDRALQNADSSLLVTKGKPLDVFQELLQSYSVEAVFSNADHEPYGIQRDMEVKKLLQAQGIKFEQQIDHLIFPPGELLNMSNQPYTVFTPYSKKWKTAIAHHHLGHFPSENHLNNLFTTSLPPIGPLEKWGFKASAIEIPKPALSSEVLVNYNERRDFPAVEGTTRIGLQLRFGTLSIRQVVRQAHEINEIFLNELIWREFYSSVLYHFPYVVDHAFKKKYERISWINNEHHFELWKHGQSGYPMVDAGMRQLKATGWMHNRLRMIVASFLTKHLLIDWRWGEAWFAKMLFDYELSSNNGGWQWCAGSGTDAAPYFRIFNPEAQQAKFDPNNAFVKKWIPELGTAAYPKAIVDHSFARNRCLEAYKDALQG